MQEITLFIADDHPIFRRGVVEVAHSHPGLRVVGEAGDGKSALEKIRELKPQLAILDLDMPGLGGLEVAKALAANPPSPPVIILSMHKTPLAFHQVMEAGIPGYVVKDNACEDLVAAIQSVAAGRPFVSPSLSVHMLAKAHQRKCLAAEKPGLEDLTPSQRRILKMIAEDKTSKEIAEELGISFFTVEKHRANICERLRLSGSHSLLKFAFDNKLAL